MLAITRSASNIFQVRNTLKLAAYRYCHYRLCHSKTQTTVMSANHLKVNENYSIDGALSGSELQALREGGHFKSFLYLCTDNGQDQGAPNGFTSISEHFGNAVHIPIDPSDAAFAPTADVHTVLPAYRKLELSLLQLPQPILISCKSNRRASMVLSAFRAIQEGRTLEETLAEASAFTFPASPGMLNFVTKVIEAHKDLHPARIQQLFETESSTYTYLVSDEVTKDAILIDPVLETVDRDAHAIREAGLTLRFALNTHCHADHITGTGQLKKLFPDMRTMISVESRAVADIHLQPFSVVPFGNRHIYCLSTPGHTEGCYSFVLDDKSAVFTGDAVLIGGCGRTDFQGGSSEQLYRSVHSSIFTLPETTIIYPAHDYKEKTSTTVLEEKTNNPRLTKPLAEFVEIMANLNLPYPKKIDASLPKNLKCGVFDD